MPESRLLTFSGPPPMFAGDYNISTLHLAHLHCVYSVNRWWWVNNS